MKRLICILLALLLIGSGALAEEPSESLQVQIDSVISRLDLSALEPIRVPGFEGEMSVEAFVRALASGDTISGEDAVAWLLEMFFDSLSGLGLLMISIMLPVVLASQLMHMLCAQRDSLCSLARSACFVLILIPVMLLVFSELEHTRRTITGMTQRMDKLLPVLLTLLTALGGSASSAFLLPMVVAASGSMVFLAREVTLRLVMCTCAVLLPVLCRN